MNLTYFQRADLVLRKRTRFKASDLREQITLGKLSILEMLSVTIAQIEVASSGRSFAPNSTKRSQLSLPPPIYCPLMALGEFANNIPNALSGGELTSSFICQAPL
jgi:hypothetical protein